MATPSSLRSRFGNVVAAVGMATLATVATAAVRADGRAPEVARSGPADAEKDLHLSLAVVRADGIMLPFASYNDGSWDVPWPGPNAGFMVPLTIEDVPKKWWGAAGPEAAWKAWLANEQTRDLKLVRPVQIQIFCTLRLGVATDYRGTLPAQPMPTLPKDALAVAGGMPPGPIQTVSKLSPDTKRVGALITAKFNQAEKLAARAFTAWEHPFDESERQTYPIEIETIYRSVETTKRGTWSTSYIEAVRKFPARPGDRGCGLITYAYGWIREEQGKPARIDLAAKVTYCDREGVPFMQPFGRLQLKGEVFWVYQLSSWRDEVYAISRVRPDKVEPVLAVSGGFCSRQQMR